MTQRVMPSHQTVYDHLLFREVYDNKRSYSAAIQQTAKHFDIDSQYVIAAIREKDAQWLETSENKSQGPF